MWQKCGGMFCHGVEGEEEKVEDDSDLDLDYKDNYDHCDNWDPEELHQKLQKDFKRKMENIKPYLVESLAEGYKKIKNDKKTKRRQLLKTTGRQIPILTRSRSRSRSS